MHARSLCLLYLLLGPPRVATACRPGCHSVHSTVALRSLQGRCCSWAGTAVGPGGLFWPHHSMRLQLAEAPHSLTWAEHPLPAACSWHRRDFG